MSKKLKVAGFIALGIIFVFRNYTIVIGQTKPVLVALNKGAADNGAGSAAVMEAARIIQASSLKPRRTIRVALWSGKSRDFTARPIMSSSISARKSQIRIMNQARSNRRTTGFGLCIIV